MQIISSLLSLQRNSIQNKEAQMILSDSRSRIKTMALVHQQLYENENLEYILLEHYLNDIVNHTALSYDCLSKFKFKINAPFYMNVDRSMYIGLITNEILTNSIKHNTETNIYFSVTINTVSDQYECLIKENGIGYDTTDKKGFGLKLITTLVQQIGGDITIWTKPNKGVEHKIVFPSQE